MRHHVNVMLIYQNGRGLEHIDDIYIVCAYKVNAWQVAALEVTHTHPHTPLHTQTHTHTDPHIHNIHTDTKKMICFLGHDSELRLHWAGDNLMR